MLRVSLLSILSLSLLVVPALAASKDRVPPPKQDPRIFEFFKPNLIIEEIEIVEKPGGILQDKYDFPEARIRVRNTGIMMAMPSSVALAAFIDGVQVPLTAQPVPFLMGGGVFDVTVSLGEVDIDEVQSYLVWAFADIGGQVTESSETDNGLIATASL